ncbi:MAG: hypothetical protein COZ18_09675 [Flexibacter sp. CG_4_10_14_3_um_filter_32_15]|nr:MAG: hypothetical protein COZ18_09675 [Flexibacter sp. CG_4_10_14_3_um_filter_32_15]
MKVTELRKKLAELKKDEIIKLAVEFYKLVPKSKKEDNNLDNLIENPNQPKPTKQKNTPLNWEELEKEINLFITHAKEQYYVYPNKIVSKKERSTWRFKVKNWYKILINPKQKDVKPELQIRLLTNLYELLCEACDYVYFSGDNPFQSIQVEQTVFFKALIVLIQEKIGKTESVNKGIELIINNPIDRNTLETYLATELISTLQIPDLKQAGIDKVKSMLEKRIEKLHLYQKELKEKRSKTKKVSHSFTYDSLEYKMKSKINDLTLIGLMFYESLYRIKDGITFYNANYLDTDEIKLYVLVREIFRDEYRNEIKNEIETAIKNGTEPRKGLLNTLKIINDGEKLPRWLSN